MTNSLGAIESLRRALATGAVRPAALIGIEAAAGRANRRAVPRPCDFGPDMDAARFERDGA